VSLLVVVLIIHLIILIDRINLMWNITVLDIEKTLSNVIIKVTHDHSVDKAAMEKRKEALLLLGAQFSQYGTTLETGLADIKGKLSEQMRAGATAAAEKEHAKDKESEKHNNSDKKERVSGDKKKENDID
jgi:hypothetical protein